MNDWIGFEMSVNNNHAIALALLWLVFSLALNYWWVTTPIRNKQGVGVCFTSKSSRVVKPSIVFVLFCVTSSPVQSNWRDWFYLAPDWFVKTGKLLREFHRFTVAWKWLACICDWLRSCFAFGSWTLKLPQESNEIENYYLVNDYSHIVFNKNN